MPSNKHLRFLLKLIYLSVGIVAAVLFFRYVLFWVLPFLIAMALAAAIEPVVRRLSERTRLPRSVAAAIMTVLVLAVFFTAAALLLLRAADEVNRLLASLPELLAKLPKAADELEVKLYRYIISMPEAAQEFLFNAADSLIERSAGIPAALYEKLMGLVSSLAGAAPRILLFAVTTALATFFTSAGFRRVKDFILRQIPARWHERVRMTKGRLKLTLWQWVKAQLLLLLITFFELTVGLLALRVDYALLLAAVIALIDALPVFGTGIILIPWAIVDLLGGNTVRGVAMLILYVLIYLVRRVLEPKLLGDRLGLDPLATLLALWVGYCVLGVGGMIIMPLALIMLKQLQEMEYISLWK